MLVNIQSLIDEAKCYETIRAIRWSESVCCTRCNSQQVIKQGFDDTQAQRQRYLCKVCGCRFDDLTNTIFAGHHQPLRTWVLCSYMMGLNLSNQQIAQELDLDPDDAEMAAQLRTGIMVNKPPVTLTGEVECDELYVVAGHKGQPDAVCAKGQNGRRRRLQAKPGRGTLAKEKPPIFGMIQRQGEVATSDAS